MNDDKRIMVERFNDVSSTMNHKYPAVNSATEELVEMSSERREDAARW